ncbi:MAG: hypothetical protein ABSH01_13950 [Terriglobia bacterium]
MTRKEGQPIENELTSPPQERLIGEGGSAGLPFDCARRDTTEVLSSTLKKNPDRTLPSDAAKDGTCHGTSCLIVTAKFVFSMPLGRVRMDRKALENLPRQ